VGLTQFSSPSPWQAMG